MFTLVNRRFLNLVAIFVSIVNNIVVYSSVFANAFVFVSFNKQML